MAMMTATEAMYRDREAQLYQEMAFLQDMQRQQQQALLGQLDPRYDPRYDQFGQQGLFGQQQGSLYRPYLPDIPIPESVKAKVASIREELQADTDKWLENTL